MKLLTILGELDSPVHIINDYQLYSYAPIFYKDHYIVLQLCAHENTLNPLLITDPNIINNNYFGTNLREAVKIVYNNAIRIHNSYYKSKYAILELHNGQYCAYIERRYLWHPFESIGVICIFSNSSEMLEKYFNNYFAGIFSPKSKYVRNTRTLII